MDGSVMNLQTEVEQHRVVQKEYLNDQGNLFGGQALHWMDEVAYLTTKKLTRQKMVTVICDKIRFRIPVTEGKTLRIVGKVISAGVIKAVIRVEVWIKDDTVLNRKCAVEGQFTFVAVDEEGKPARIIPIA
jgi:acyl-CoA hydrolase